LVLATFAFIAFDVIAVTALHTFLFNRTDSTLQSALNVTSHRLDKLLSRARAGAEPAGVQRGRRDYYLAFVPNHGKTMTLKAFPALEPKVSSDLSAIANHAGAQTLSTLDGHGHVRVQAKHVGDGILLASVGLDDVNATVGRLELIVGVGSASALVLVTLGVFMVVGGGLRPIEEMAAQADRINAGDLTNRVSPSGTGSEVARLGDALNGMLTRIEASIRDTEAGQDLMRRFFADASHELRTPLASLRANAELYQQGALTKPSQVHETIRRIQLDAQRMSRLVDDMLRLAHFDEHAERQHETVDLSAVVHGCVERAELSDEKRTWRRDIAADLIATGDEELIRRAIDNLLANVHAHTPEHTVATISAMLRGSRVVVEVSDDGPGVPANELTNIFDRFHRVGTRTPGSGAGLGLSIVAEVASTHGGTAHAALNEPHGLRVTLSIPAWRDPHRPQEANATPHPSPRTEPTPV
jgi:two-component system OmpR family sensor kinase